MMDLVKELKEFQDFFHIKSLRKMLRIIKDIPIVHNKLLRPG